MLQIIMADEDAEARQEGAPAVTAPEVTSAYAPLNECLIT